jgi:hypothetical protein
MNVGFTGHRALADPSKVAAAIAAAMDGGVRRYGAVRGVSSLAVGADTLFVEELARRGLPYILLLPFPAEVFRQDFDEAGWRRAEPLLARAAAVEITPPAPSRTQAYRQTGLRTVERAELMLAVWDHRPPTGPAATGAIVEYARTLRKPLVLIDARSGRQSQERLELLPQAGSNRS